MPLNSRLSRPDPNAVTTPSPAADQPTTSPRRRLSTVEAAADAATVRTDTLEDQEGLEEVTVAAEENPPEPEEDVKQAPVEEKPATGRPVGAKDKAPRTRKPAAASLPPDAAESDDPAVLRKVLTSIEAEAKTLRTEYEAAVKQLDLDFAPKREELTKQHRAVSLKLSNNLF